MKIILNNTKFYEINYDYVAYLSQFDSQVYCHHKYKSSIKPYIGIIIGLSNYKYFIPLTSAKEKHVKFPLKSREHLTIYREVMINDNKSNAIYLPYDRVASTKKQIIAVLEIKKMIPVHDGCYQAINIKQLQADYQLLLNEEYLFCKRHKQDIIVRAEKLYLKNKIKQDRPTPYACDYCKLEQYAHQFNKKHQR